MTSKSEIALEKFSEGFNCAQSVFYSFCDQLQFDKNMALKLASGFGGGMGRKGEVCGAVTGGLFVIGMQYGWNEKGNQEAKDAAYAKTREFMDQFAGKHGSCICRQLLNGCNLATEEGQKQFKENDLSNRVCKPCVKSAVEILEKIMV